MSFLLGGHKKSKPEFTGLAIQTSNSAIAISIGFGKNRGAGNIVWQDDFQSHAHSAGGKGGGGKGSKTYTYSGSFILSLGWGPGAIVQVWNDKSKTSGSAPFTVVAGNVPQAPWGYLSSNHPGAALGYAGLILACVANLDLGSSNTLPQFSFEIEWPLFNTAPGGTGDADPAQAADLFMNSPVYGALVDPMPVDNLFSTGAATTTGDHAFQTYCQAMGFGFSPLLDNQEAGTDTLLRWATIFNFDLGWTGYSLAFVPRSLDPASGNGVVYLPDSALEFALSDANGDFLYDQGAEPVRLQRARRSQLPNYGSLEICNRANEYNTEPAPWDDQGLIDQFGPSGGDSVTAHEICEQSIGVVCAALYGQRVAYAANKFEFSTGPGFKQYVVGSIGTIDDPQFGIQQVRVVDMQESDDGSFSVLVEEWNGSVASAPPSSAEGVSNNPVNTGIPAGAVNPPIIFEPPSSLAGSQAQVWIAASAGPAGAFDPNWGGCFVWLSLDGSSYTQAGEIDAPARMGVLSSGLAAYGGSNPDTIDSFSVDLSESAGELVGVTATDAAASVTLSVIKDAGGAIEFLSFRDATLGGAFHYTLGGQLYRGLYSSAAGAHLSGAAFARLDDDIFKLDLAPQFIDQTIFIKLQSFNIFGNGLQDLSTCTAYSYTPSGAGFGGGSGGVPTTPATPTASAQPGFDLIAWAANPASDNVDHYDVYRAPGIGAPAKIGSSSGTSYTDATATGGSSYTYSIVAVNAIGPSAASAGASVTAIAAAGVLRLYGGTEGRAPDPGEILFELEMVGGENFAAGFPSNLGGCDIAPTNAFSCPIYKAGSLVGSMDIAPGATSATWTLASPLSFTSGQKFKFAAPAIQDPTLSGLFYTFVGGR